MPTGRRGGTCHQLNVPVRGNWKACQLMIPTFTPTWDEVSYVSQATLHFSPRPVTVDLQEFPPRISTVLLEELQLQSMER